MQTDEELFSCFISGDEAGLSTLMERYGDRLTLYINGYIRDVSDAEDLMIEAFSRVCAREPRLQEGGFKPYIFKTARHLALRELSRLRRSRFFGFDDVELEPECDELIENVVQTRERDEILRVCMEKLSPDYREVLYLTFFEGMRHSQAAEIMGKSEKQIENLIYRGKKALKPLLEGEGITNAKYI